MPRKHKYTLDQVKEMYADRVAEGIFDPDTRLNTLTHTLNKKLPNYHDYEIYESTVHDLLDDIYRPAYTAIRIDRTEKPFDARTLQELRRQIDVNYLPPDTVNYLDPSTLADDYLYHFTDRANIPSIRKKGLIPQVVRSGYGPKYPAIWFNAEESFTEDTDDSFLRVPLNSLDSNSLQSVGQGILYLKPIPAKYLEIFNENLDEWEPLLR